MVKEEPEELEIEGSEESSDLEEVVEDSPKVVVKEIAKEILEEAPERWENSDRFTEWVVEGIKSSTSLERVTGSNDVGWHRDPNAREEAPKSFRSGGDAFKYDAAKEEEPQVKYLESSHVTTTSRVDFSEVGRNVNPFEVREAGSVSSENFSNEFKMQETYDIGKNIDTSGAGRENPFRRRELPEAEKVKSDYIVK